MKKDEFLKYTFEEILNMVNKEGFLKQKIDDQYVFSFMLKTYSTDKIIKIIDKNINIINEKNEDYISYLEILINSGKGTVLENYVSNINLLQKTSDKELNILGYLIKKGCSSLLFKALKFNKSAINEKDSSGCVGVERLADAGYTSILEHYAEDIDLLKKEFKNEKNMLGYLISKGMSSVVLKALSKKPEVINEKDSSGCVGVERLADAGYSNILSHYAEHIDLLKKDFRNEKNMLGYLISKGMSSVLLKALGRKPEIINEKDSSGCVGVERLADAGYSNILEHYAEHIDLLKKEFKNEKNMLGYLISKGMSSVVLKALSKKPEVINEKDSSGCVGVERLADAGYSNILSHYAEYIDLLKKDYENKKNMLGYLSKKGMVNVITKTLELNSLALNEKDSSGYSGVERLADVGAIDLINEYSNKIDWTKTTNNQKSIFQYVIKLSNSQAEEITMKALLKNPEILPKEIKFIIDYGLSNVLTYKEIVSKVDKNMMIDNINLLGYLTSKNKEHCVDILLNTNKSQTYFSNKKNEEKIDITDNKMMTNLSIYNEEIMKNTSIVKEIIIEQKYDTTKELHINKPANIKSKIKAML